MTRWKDSTDAVMADRRRTARNKAEREFRLSVVGCSLGGMNALLEVIGELPATFPVPIAVVQHRYRTSNESLPSYFRRHAHLNVVDADDKQWMKPGNVYLAPANYHLLVEQGELSLSVDEAVAYSRPPLDVLFD